MKTEYFFCDQCKKEFIPMVLAEVSEGNLAYSWRFCLDVISTQIDQNGEHELHLCRKCKLKFASKFFNYLEEEYNSLERRFT